MRKQRRCANAQRLFAHGFPPAGGFYGRMTASIRAGLSLRFSTLWVQPGGQRAESPSCSRLSAPFSVTVSAPSRT